jgi:hypothetical protein
MIDFDSAYVAKFYLNEPGQAAVRSCAIVAGEVATCALALAEVNAVFHRKLREGFLVSDGWEVGAIPKTVFLHLLFSPLHILKCGDTVSLLW